MNLTEAKKLVAEACGKMDVVWPATLKELEQSSMDVFEANVRRIVHAATIYDETHRWLFKLCSSLGIEPEDGQIVSRRQAVSKWVARRFVSDCIDEHFEDKTVEQRLNRIECCLEGVLDTKLRTELNGIKEMQVVDGGKCKICGGDGHGLNNTGTDIIACECKDAQLQVCQECGSGELVWKRFTGSHVELSNGTRWLVTGVEVEFDPSQGSDAPPKMTLRLGR